MPFGLLVWLEQTPVPGLQTPGFLHAPDTGQTTGFDPVHVPDWQASVCAQSSASSHDVPFGLFGFEQTPVVVLHVPAL